MLQTRMWPPDEEVACNERHVRSVRRTYLGNRNSPMSFLSFYALFFLLLLACVRVSACALPHLPTLLPRGLEGQSGTTHGFSRVAAGALECGSWLTLCPKGA